MCRWATWTLLLALGADEGLKVSPLDRMPQVLIPAGEFTMGADDADAHGRTAEFPPHRVYLDAFWIDQHEVTQAQYAAFLNRWVKGNLAQIYSYCDLGNPACRIRYNPKTQLCEVQPGYEEHPVCAVSWAGADAYARRMRRRLPTEAEWEKAARGTDGRRYPWGNDWDPRKTNTREAGPGGTVPVGRVSADRSPYGVWDMAGNVREWVADGWDEDFYYRSPARNPLCDEGRQRPVVRGGAWCLTEWDARVTSRQMLPASAQRRYMGFRCAESVPAPLPEPARTSADVLFYAPMDGYVYAAAARGQRRPLTQPPEADLVFVPGRRGQAVLLGQTASKDLAVEYDAADNFRIDQGTVALWIQLRGWKGTDRGYRFFFMIRDENTCKFYLYRYGERHLLVLAGNGIEGQWGSVGMPTDAWQDGQWVHLAVTWKNRTVTLYVDGRPVGKTVVAPELYFRGMPPSFALGQSVNWDHMQKRAQTAIDEVVIFSRALGPEEIVRERGRTGLP